jgi:hypothetical protein
MLEADALGYALVVPELLGGGGAAGRHDEALSRELGNGLKRRPPCLIPVSSGSSSRTFSDVGWAEKLTVMP